MYNPKLTSILTGSTAAMITLVTVAQGMSLRTGAMFGDHLGPQVFLLLLGSSVATLLLMRSLYLKLQQTWSTLEESRAQALLAARTDSLTGLGNRAFLIERLEQLSDSDVEVSYALLLLDLNNFKRVNDTRGHAAGDELIRLVGRRLSQLLPTACIARLGGDEFAILHPLEVGQDPAALCADLSIAVRKPYSLGGQDTYVGGSIGATLVHNGAEASELIRQADVAMYDAKTSDNHFRLFDEEMARNIQRKAHIEQKLRTALAGSEGLEAQFQPVVAVDGAVVGLEALLRWHDKTLGAVAPREILAVAEDTNLSDELTRFVAEKACDAAIEFPHLMVALNLTATQTLSEGLASRLASMFRERGVEPSRIQLEMTESAFVQRPAELSHALAALHEQGFQLATDDFGTSNSALSYLRRAHISTVKIDRSLLVSTRIMGTIALMSASVHLAKLLGLKVVCEGVSDLEEEQIALQTGCDYMQGFHYYTPMRLSELRLALHQHQFRQTA